MTHTDTLNAAAADKPRLAFMGEFSAGKSTLSKLFLGNAPLPVQITATRLPPVWMSYGDEAAFAVGHDGVETAIDVNALEDVRLEETRLIRLFSRSETLEICDLIDMPGISDPSMSPDVWKSVLDEVDSVVWCTLATQAWRQSEAAAWEMIKERTNGDNILLVTQVDKLRSERDVERVMARVGKETKGLFKAVYPISILEAINAGDDFAKWQASGAAEFVDHVVELLLQPSGQVQVQGKTQAQHAVLAEDAEIADVASQTAAPEAAPEPVIYNESSVVPKRVRVLTEMRGQTMRPSSLAGMGL
ncbi:hypothetical protein N4R57_16465 [Rhodobacteraceae bacterium D3-12]|nr:hypothetical protein N4R57_16465 [Rhodobacteraceae bacterium D3-12]